MPTIATVHAREILDSRGRPTVEATCALDDGTTAAASVPSGASTGRAEALELRDGDPARYRGLGCRNAVANVNGPIRNALRGLACDRQADLDAALLALDGSGDKSRLGANAILAVSLAFARAHAAAEHQPLYAHFARMLGQVPRTLPRMTINLFSGGKHAGGQVPIQDVLLVPSGASTIDDGLAMTYAIYQAAAELTTRKYGTRALRADEGGLAPPFRETAEMFNDAYDAIAAAGLKLGEDVHLALDVASSHFFHDGKYHLESQPMTSIEMIDRLSGFVGKFHIVSVEDGLAEEDWGNWPLLLRTLSDRALVVGDDFLCTNPARIRRAVEARAASALLLKVNQIGTLTEAAEALRIAREAGWLVTVSARSGETEDNWLADLAVGWAADQIKVGSITQSERLAKYNRLLQIESETKLPIVAWPTRG